MNELLKELLFKFFKKPKPARASKKPAALPSEKKLLLQPDAKELDRVIRSDFPEGRAPGYVYFVQEHLHGSFKIGKTKHLDKRMNLFSVKLPFKHELIFLIKSGNHHQTEIAFHKHFASKRLEGEWFSLTQKDVAWIKKRSYTEEIKKTIYPALVSRNQPKKNTSSFPLTEKQINYAKSLVKRLDRKYKLMVEYSSLTNEDLDRLIVYSKFKNAGALKALVKKGVLKSK